MSWRVTLFCVLLQTLHRSAAQSSSTTTAPGGSTTAKPDECTVTCPATGTVQLPDPLDCHTFYLCVDGTELGPLDCPNGQYFDTDKCVPNGAEECTPICGGGGGGGVCSYSCDNPNGFKADFFDCSSYYKCDDKKGTLMTCNAATPFFDGSECHNDETKCCHCKPFCYVGDNGHKVIDPIDCTKYYVCIEENEVPEFFGHCNAGNFDPFLGDCSTLAPCITLCTNVINSKGCIDVFTCEEAGYFPACPNLCDPKFYHCYTEDLGSIVTPIKCGDGTYFDAEHTNCQPLANCPDPSPGH